MNKHLDYIGGFLASAMTFAASHFNELLGAAIGLVSLGVMLLRFRREWRHRNDKPSD